MPTKSATAVPSRAEANHRGDLNLSPEEGFIAGAEYYVREPLYPMVLCILKPWLSAATHETRSGAARVSGTSRGLSPATHGRLQHYSCILSGSSRCCRGFLTSGPPASS